MSIHKSRIEGVRGSLATLTGGGDTLALPHLCTPIIAVVAAEKPVRFEASLDGREFVPVRDKDGLEFRLTKPGIYRLPAPVLFIRPITTDDAAVVQLFIGASHD